MPLCAVRDRLRRLQGSTSEYMGLYQLVCYNSVNLHRQIKYSFNNSFMSQHMNQTYLKPKIQMVLKKKRQKFSITSLQSPVSVTAKYLDSKTNIHLSVLRTV